MNPSVVSLNIAAAIGNLPEVQGFVRYQAEKAGAQETLQSRLELVVEELFVNIVEYSQSAAAQQPAAVEIRCHKQTSPDNSDQFFCIAFHDWGLAFNPLEQPTPSLDTDVEARQIGGLGIFLVNHMADFCSYSREQESNQFQACFRL